MNGAKALVALSSALTTDSALTGLAANAGTLVLENGAALTTAVGLDNTDTISVNSYYGSGIGGSSLTVGGTLTNEDVLYIGYYGNNTAATTVSAAALSNFSLSNLQRQGHGDIESRRGFDNGRNGTVYVDDGGSGGSRVTIGGTLTNNGGSKSAAPA